jgi:hypothetical protein
MDDKELQRRNNGLLKKERKRKNCIVEVKKMQR